MLPDEVAEDVPLRNTPERRVIPCKRGHDLSLSHWREYWRCRGCEREWSTAADARAKLDPKPAPSEVRKVPCKHGHAADLSYWAGSRWRCRGCQRAGAKRWRDDNPDKAKANQVRQDAKRKERREAARMPEDEKVLRRMARQSVANLETGCREWTGKLERGYGRTRYHGRGHYAHRVARMLLRGPIPSGQVVDHLCHNRKCIEPTHLRLTSPEGNGANKPQAPAGRLAALWERLAGIEGTHLVRG